MTEAPETPAPAARKRYTVLFIILGVLILIALVYAGGNFLLPSSIKSSYQGKDCATVLSLNSTYTSIYPAAIVDKSIAAPVQECALYSVAGASEEQKTWQEAYNAYQSYTATYPKGLFHVEAHQHTALVLQAWAKDLLAQKKYDQAVTKLDQAYTGYADTAAAADTTGLITQVYTTWGTDLRSSSDFSGSEQIIKTFKTWAQANKQDAAVKAAQHELAQTYLSWGLALQGQKSFEDAKAKLDLAMSTDPEPLAASGPAAQAKAAQAKLYTQWGDAFLAKKDFAGAIEHYMTVITLSESKDQPAAKDTVANAYLQWAASLRDNADFQGALQQVDEAGKNTGTANATTSVESAKADTYTAFSKSSGLQAQRVMKDALRPICENKQKPDLPIFAVDKAKVQAAIYGVDDKLPVSVAAVSPGAMHYVACIEMVTQTVAVRTFYWAKMVAEKYQWKVTLRDVTSGEAIATTSLDGGVPPALPVITRSNFMDILLGGSFQRYRGTNPDVADLANWLLNVMK